jgi:hypothetical protein
MLERTDGESIMDNPGTQTLDKDRERAQINKGNNKITELRAILQRESQIS